MKKLKQIHLSAGERIPFDRCTVSAGSLSFDIRDGELVKGHNGSLNIPSVGTAYHAKIYDLEMADKDFVWLHVDA